MGKLIDIDDIFGEKVIMVSQNAYDEVMKLMRMIREAPEVDAVPVVRCKDCKHYVETGWTFGDCHLDRWGDGFGNYAPPVVGEDGFCSWGERRKDAVE